MPSSRKKLIEGARPRNALHPAGTQTMIYRFSFDEGVRFIDGQPGPASGKSIDNLSTQPWNLSTDRIPGPRRHPISSPAAGGRNHPVVIRPAGANMRRPGASA